MGYYFDAFNFYAIIYSLSSDAIFSYKYFYTVFKESDSINDYMFAIHASPWLVLRPVEIV